MPAASFGTALPTDAWALLVPCNALRDFIWRPSPPFPPPLRHVGQMLATRRTEAP